VFIDLFPTYIYMSGFILLGWRNDNRNFHSSKPGREPEVKKRDFEIELNDGQFLFLGNFLGNFLCGDSDLRQ